MVFNARRWLGYGLLFALLLAPFFALGQAPVRSSKATQPADPDQEQRDNPAGRQAWFLKGRMVAGKNAAALLARAHQQKMALRRAQQQKAAQRAAQQQTATAAGGQTSLTSAPTILGQGTGPAWTNIGPAPITGNSTGTSNGGFSNNPQGNFSGRVQAVVVDPNDATGNTVYVGSAYGGVWKTTNGTNVPHSGVIWTSLFDTDPAAATLSVGAVTVLPCGGACGPNGPVILVGTGEPDNAIDSYYGLGLLRFDPVGNAWSLISTANSGAISLRGMGFSKIAFSTANPNLVVAAAAATSAPNGGNTIPGTTRGIYFSTDAGQSWTLASIFDPGNVQICIPATSTQRLLRHGCGLRRDHQHLLCFGALPRILCFDERAELDARFRRRTHHQHQQLHIQHYRQLPDVPRTAGGAALDRRSLRGLHLR